MVRSENGGPTDPSTLTTRQLLREIESLEKLFTQRVDAVERAVNVAHDDLVRVPTAVDKAIGNLDTLVSQKLRAIKKTFETVYEKFASVQTQFKERDVRTEQNARDTKVAVDAALSAAEKAVSKQQEAAAQAIAKSETNTAKQIDAQALLIAANKAALEQQISDLKERMTKMESTGQGVVQATTLRQAQTSGSNATVMMIVGIIVGSAGVIFGIIELITHSAK